MINSLVDYALNNRFIVLSVALVLFLWGRFVNRRGRPFSANKLREKVLHPLLEKLGIPRGGFHSLRHGATTALLADGATPAIAQKQLRHSDPRITLGVHGHVIGNQQRDAVEDRSARIEHLAVQ